MAPCNGIKGTGEEYRSLGGVEATREIYIYRVCKGAKPEDLKDFATNKVNLDVRDLTLVSDPTWDTQSFKLSLPASQLDAALKADWPAGICVRRWWFSPHKRGVVESQNDS